MKQGIDSIITKEILIYLVTNIEDYNITNDKIKDGNITPSSTSDHLKRKCKIVPDFDT